MKFDPSKERSSNAELGDCIGHFRPPQSRHSVSVILPVYNEQAFIQRTFKAILQYLPSHPNVTFIFVNDGSSDRTKAMLYNAIQATKTRQIQLLSYFPNAGKGYAIQKGIEYANSDLVCYIDSDLAYSLDHLDLMIHRLKTYDIVIGCRCFTRRLTQGNSQGLQWSRKLAGKAFNLLCRWILNLPYRDTQAGLKGFRREVAQTLFAQQTLSRFSFDVELIYLAKKRGYSIGEIPAKVCHRHQKKNSKVNLLQDSIQMLIDLLKIRWNDQLGRYR